MKKHGYLMGAVLSLVLLAFAASVMAQDAPEKREGKARVEGQASDRGFDFRIQGGEADRDRGQPPREGDRGMPGPQGPAGERGPQGPSGPSGGGSVLGMDPNVALLVGLAVLAVVIVAIVAASRSRE